MPRRSSGLMKQHQSNTSRNCRSSRSKNHSRCSSCFAMSSAEDQKLAERHQVWSHCQWLKWPSVTERGVLTLWSRRRAGHRLITSLNPTPAPTLVVRSGSCTDGWPRKQNSVKKSTYSLSLWRWDKVQARTNRKSWMIISSMGVEYRMQTMVGWSVWNINEISDDAGLLQLQCSMGCRAGVHWSCSVTEQGSVLEWSGPGEICPESCVSNQPEF